MRGEGRTLLSAARTGLCALKAIETYYEEGEEARERPLFY